MFSFDDLAAVTVTLDRLAARLAAQPAAQPAAQSDGPTTEAPVPREPNATGPLVTLLPRQPGSREARYAHLLGGPVASAPTSEFQGTAEIQAAAGFQAATSPALNRIAELEAQILSLQSLVQNLERRIDALEASAAPTPEPRLPKS
jgi:uncharacterized protein YceH (UPF0502 family)